MKSKLLKKISSVVITTAVIMSCFCVTVKAETQDGSKEHPYLIKTASELQNIRNDLSSNYKLAADINCSGIYFIPLGNEDDGAFTGSFDGAGFKISNLTVEDGYKYSGLFGYNEGVVENVVLKNAKIPCIRYAGGVVAFNSIDASVNNCTTEVNITGGNEYFDSFAGGIIGYNVDGKAISYCSAYGSITGSYLCYGGGIIGYAGGTTTVTDCINRININISSSTYVGGMIGYAYSGNTVTNCINYGNVSSYYSGGMIGYARNSSTVTNCINYGNVSSNGYSGGMIGYADSDSTVTNCINYGIVSSYYSSGGMIGYARNSSTVTNCINYGIVSSSYNSGGMIGCAYSDSTVTNCINYGNVSSNGYSGGMIGYADSDSTVTNCINYGIVSSSYNSGGMIGYAYSDSTVTNCINYGNVSSYSNQSNAGGMIGYADRSSTVTNCINYGNVSSSSYIPYAGGMIGYAYSGSTVTNCINYGNVSSDGYSGGMIGYARNSSTVTNCINYGIVSSYYSSGGMIGYANSDSTVTNCINYRCFYSINNYSDIKSIALLSLAEIKNSSDILDNLNSAEELWEADSRFNSGLPMLKNSSPLLLNEAVLELKPNETAKLNAFYNKVQTHDITFTSKDTSVARVSDDGTVKAVKNGVTTISAVMEDGTKASCLVYVITSSSSINIEESSVSLIAGRSYTLGVVRGNNSNDAIWFESSDETVVSVDQKGTIYAIKSGTATITATSLVNGVNDTCTVIVTSPVTKITLPESVSVNIGSPYTVTPTVTPSLFDGELNWTSFDTNVAKVTANGTVIGISPGTTKISVTSENGCYAECDVTVKQPSLYVLLSKKSVELEMGLSYKLSTALYPENSTDTLSFSSSSTGVATVSNDGIITALKAGTATITVKSSSGATDTCTVTVKNKTVFPESVTLDTYEANIQVNEFKQLTSTVLPSNVTDKAVKWYSLDEKIVTVSDTGVIKGIGSGTTTVKAVSSNGIFAECSVTVIDYFETPKIVLSNASSLAGKTVTLDLETKNNYGFSSLSIDITYDTDNLEFVSCENLIGGFTLTTGKSLVFEGSDNFTGNGIIAKLTFKVKDNAPENQYEINAVLDAVNQKMQPVNLEFIGGKITVIKLLYGDTNGDGTINALDLTVMQQALLTNSEYNEVFDTNGDGILNLLDLVKLKKHLADNTIPLGKQNTPSQENQIVSEVANLPKNKIVA